MAELRRTRRRRWIVATAVVVGAGLLVAAIWTDVDARTRSRNEQAALAAANAHLASLRHDAALTRFANAITTSKRNTLQSSITSTTTQLAATNAALASTNVHAYEQGIGIKTLQTCLGGRQERLRTDHRQEQRSGGEGHLGRGGLVHPARRGHERPAWSTRSTFPTPT